MTLREVKKRLQYIEEIADDDESAHAEQDSLFYDVLLHISKGNDANAILAREAIRAADIKFSRWCA